VSPFLSSVDFPIGRSPRLRALTVDLADRDSEISCLTGGARKIRESAKPEFPSSEREDSERLWVIGLPDKSWKSIDSSRPWSEEVLEE
jgi:hypothetical protein